MYEWVCATDAHGVTNCRMSDRWAALILRTSLRTVRMQFLSVQLTVMCSPAIVLVEPKEETAVWECLRCTYLNEVALCFPSRLAHLSLCTDVGSAVRDLRARSRKVDPNRSGSGACGRHEQAPHLPSQFPLSRACNLDLILSVRFRHEWPDVPLGFARSRLVGQPDGPRPRACHLLRLQLGARLCYRLFVSTWLVKESDVAPISSLVGRSAVRALTVSAPPRALLISLLLRLVHNECVRSRW